MIRLLCAVSVATLAMLTFAGEARAEISEPGPYYALPSWDQQLPASTRFIVLTNWGSAAVLDRETGLVWQQNPVANDSETWAQALSDCLLTAFGGRFGWRLPSQEELATLVDPSTGAVFSGTPFTLPMAYAFWAATTDPTDTSRAFAFAHPGFRLPLSQSLKVSEIQLGASEAIRARRARNNDRV